MTGDEKVASSSSSSVSYFTQRGDWNGFTRSQRAKRRRDAFIFTTSFSLFLLTFVFSPSPLRFAPPSLSPLFLPFPFGGAKIRVSKLFFPLRKEGVGREEGRALLAHLAMLRRMAAEKRQNRKSGKLGRVR